MDFQNPEASYSTLKELSKGDEQVKAFDLQLLELKSENEKFKVVRQSRKGGEIEWIYNKRKISFRMKKKFTRFQ